MKLLLILLRKSRRFALLTILFGLLSGVSSASLVALINRALNQGPQGTLTGIALPFIDMALTALLTRMFSQFMLNRLQQSIMLDLRLWISRHLLTTSLRKLEEAGAHRMLTSLVQDTVTLGTGVMVLPEIFISTAIVLAALIYMAWLSLPLFLTLAGFMVVGLLTYSLPASFALRYQQQAREENGTLFRRFMAMADGAKELRLNRNRRRAFFDVELSPLAQSVRRLYLRSDDFFSIANSWGMFIYVFLIGILMLVVPSFTSISQSELVGAVLVVLFIQQPLNTIASLTPNLRRSEVAMAQIEKLGLKLTPESSVEKALPEAPQQPPRTFERIELAGVTHTYRSERDDEKFTLGPITTSLRSGELLFLVGGNGSGKTTLAKLLTGLYVPEAGEIQVDGKPVTAEALDDYRQYFAAVFFDFFVFERLLGLSSPELLRDAQRYLAELHLEQKVRIQEDGKLSTTALSQGQRKRLALLVAYLENRPVYVFDEWAADQDPMFKEVFYKQILPDLKSRGKAVVVISHDDRYFHLADRLIRLESGQLVADEKPSEKRTEARSA